MKILTTLLASALALVLCTGLAQAAETLHDTWQKNVAGKRIVYFPVSFAQGLPHIWGVEMKKEAEALGIKFEIRDPDFNPQREEQMIAAMIPQKPDVMIVHNPNVQVLANVLKKAQEAGIYVIQVNMASRTRTDAYVGIYPEDDGIKMAQSAVDACSGPDARSHKVALMIGEPTSAYTMGILKGAMSVFDQHKDIKIVSRQAANWDPKTAHDKADTVLQANPDLCAYIGWWVGQDVGIAQAVKRAGLQGKVKVITTGGGEPPACEYLKQGLFYEAFNYNALLQAHEMMAIAKFLLQSGQPAGTFHATIYTPVVGVTKDTVTPASCAHVK